MDKRIIESDPLQTLINYGGYYKCPIDENGNFLGPLVAYAGDYKNKLGEIKNYVGDTYFNIAKVEPYLDTRNYFTDLMIHDLTEKLIDYPDRVIGMPLGGIKFSQSFGDKLNVPSIFAEKKVIKKANPAKGTKEKSEIIIARHEILSKEKIIIVEDLCNNYTTTQKAIKAIEAFGATVIGIACVVNRSNFQVWNDIPVISAIFKPCPQYEQEDSKVNKLVQNDNVIWKAKHFWAELEKKSK